MLVIQHHSTLYLVDAIIQLDWVALLDDFSWVRTQSFKSPFAFLFSILSLHFPSQDSWSTLLLLSQMVRESMEVHQGNFLWGADLEVAGITSSCFPLARPEVTWTQLTKEEAGKCNQTTSLLRTKRQWIWWAQSTFCLSIFLFSSPPTQYIESESGKESEVAQSCPTLCDPMNCSPPGSSIHGIL